MSYRGLNDFIEYLESHDELLRIAEFADPVLEITEIADRMVKNGGKALLFENTGTEFPLLINMFASDSRMAAAIGRKSIEDAGEEIMALFESFGSKKGFLQKLKEAPGILRLLRSAPRHKRGRGACQAVVMNSPDLSMLPVLRCWPHDGGRFITLPLVHTRHPETQKTNLGMYRMQVMGPDTTGMHWHRHKTGATHFEAWKESRGGRMPVTVSLGGDPVYTYAATAPMPENIDEYLLAGFLRKKSVKLVKCLTNDLWVPEDSDFVIEGYVDTAEAPVWEGPFGDHTGFYSLADWYPKFHVTCITHRKDAVYPATIVGVPPMEDAWIGRATEKIFTAPIRMAVAPEIKDLHMPVEGVAHNLVVVTIDKKYPGQGMKVLGALFGAGQMMFSKYIVVVSSPVKQSDYMSLATVIFRNTLFPADTLRLSGPLDVLDHSSDTCSYGGKMGIDATVKMKEELNSRKKTATDAVKINREDLGSAFPSADIISIQDHFIVILPVKDENILFNAGDFTSHLPENVPGEGVIIILTDRKAAGLPPEKLIWIVLSNTDPGRDIQFLNNGAIIVNACSKTGVVPPFPREWPNIVCSDPVTIQTVDSKWDIYNLGSFIESPSLSLIPVTFKGGASADHNLLKTNGQKLE